MTGMQAVILWASFLGVIAANGESSGCGTTGDGYLLLQVNVTFTLTNFSFGLRLSDKINCVSSTTTDKTESSPYPTVKENIKFKGESGWSELKKRFKFFGSSGERNTMSPTEDTINSAGQQDEAGVSQNQAEAELAVPEGNYTFTYFGPGCTVLTVVPAKNEEAAEAAAPEKRSDARMPQCMLWVKKDEDTARNCCEDYFQNSCSPGSRIYVGTGEQCKPNEQVSQAKSK
ncbi:uncharacterized protein LOC142768648 [Rhipicephalus microplus]|uniref:uncharacterized protein LOC142768648 n=1 Tax=Rhipicephalus microplus TaxID=6941 RepID=UPI003F6AAE12